MKQTIALKMETTPEQFHALLETMEAFNAGGDYVAEVAFQKHSANKIALQPFVYTRLREEFKRKRKRQRRTPNPPVFGGFPLRWRYALSAKRVRLTSATRIFSRPLTHAVQ
jgi:predicted transposase